MVTLGDNMESAMPWFAWVNNSLPAAVFAVKLASPVTVLSLD